MMRSSHGLQRLVDYMTDPHPDSRHPGTLRKRPSGSMPLSMTGEFLKIRNVIALPAILALVAVAYLRDLGRNPYGFFCDEALIGVQASQLLDGTRPEGAFSLFYSHFGTTAGALPVYATAPFVAIFGLSEFSVRFASVFFMTATFVVLFLTFRRLEIGTPWLPVVIFALTPIVIHISRINFGHAPSLFLIALGYSLYLRGRDARRIWLVIAGGVAIGASAYAYPGFYIATPVFLGIVVVTELYFLRFRLCYARMLIAFAGVALLCIAPIIYRGLTDPAFLQRFTDKDQAGYGLVSTERAEAMIQNYPKYYSFEFLFERGDWGLPGSFIQRHSVEGAGLVSWTILPLFLLGLLGFITRGRGGAGSPDRRAFAPFVALAFLVPLPDLITTAASRPPYTFAMFTGALVIPFVAAFGLATLERRRDSGIARADTAADANLTSRLESSGQADPLWSIWMEVTSARFITVMIVVSAFFFVFSTYARYPLVSSGFWGWQAGPREMIGYYLDHRAEYDTFSMEGTFNEPAIFLDFYIDDPDARQRASIGTPGNLDPARRQLFGVSRETFETDLSAADWTILETVSYPNDDIAFYLIERKGM